MFLTFEKFHGRFSFNCLNAAYREKLLSCKLLKLVMLVPFPQSVVGSAHAPLGNLAEFSFFKLNRCNQQNVRTKWLSE